MRFSYRKIGRILLGIGTFLAVVGWGGSITNSERSRPAICPGKIAAFGSWTVALSRIQPVSGPGYTALESTITAKKGIFRGIDRKAQLRESNSSTTVDDGSILVSSWNGQLSITPAEYRSSTGCMVYDLTWYPFRNWGKFGLIVCALGIASLIMSRIRGTLGRMSSANFKAIALSVCLSIACLGLFLIRPKEEAADIIYPGAAGLIDVRKSLNENKIMPHQWLIIADALVRNGRYSEGARILLGAVESNPNDAESWLAIGDAMYSAAGGKWSQAAEFAYDRADIAAPKVNKIPDYVTTDFEQSGRQNLAIKWRQTKNLIDPNVTPSPNKQRPLLEQIMRQKL